MEQNLQIADLLDMDAAGTHLIAGAGGIERRVLWAHSCELPDPYRWLGPNELLMTVGLCIPANPHDQVLLIRQLANAGLAGMAIGDDQMAPPLDPVMLAEADSLDFPLMITRGVPFASIGRMVAAANSNTQTQQVLTLSRLYQIILEPHEERDGFMKDLGRVFHVHLCCIDRVTGATLLPGGLQPTEDELHEIGVMEQVATVDRHRRIGALRDNSVSVWQINARRGAVLLVDEGQGSMLDSFTLVHLSRAVAVEADRRADMALAIAARGRQILNDAYSGEVSTARLEREAEDHGFPMNEFYAVVAPPENAEMLMEALSMSSVLHASSVRNDYLISLISGNELGRAIEVLGFHGIRAGISNSFAQISEVREAALRAQWAYESIGSGAKKIISYDEATFSITPRTESEAHEVIERVLGPLGEIGSGAPTPLIETLCVYLDEDRNWKATSGALGIHRQTLAYRLTRIEKLTGRSLKSTRDLAEFWVARIALKQH